MSWTTIITPLGSSQSSMSSTNITANNEESSRPSHGALKDNFLMDIFFFFLAGKITSWEKPSHSSPRDQALVVPWLLSCPADSERADWGREMKVAQEKATMFSTDLNRIWVCVIVRTRGGYAAVTNKPHNSVT